MATIRITNLRLRTRIGTNDGEREEKQGIVVNIVFEYNAAKAGANDDLRHAVDYKKMTEAVIKEVETAQFFLLEKLADVILKIVMSFSTVDRASVRVDKPQALRFADSVSVEVNGTRK
jgi:D-erythro-7,8-dihydroneopterin triphosphate epimerase